MGRIILLDELTANKIAAGEVVERPASVVKELMENSIDAGSTRIEIAVIDGGLTEIIVADNGSGMDADDAGLALERHATSKISGADDLTRITTLGFRGEALPSIASVARLRLKTRPRDNLSGTEIVIEGGKILKTGETGCPPGTILEVRELFYNTPARKKHLKKQTAETGCVSDIVSRYAMGYPGISFQLKSNGRVVLQTPGTGDLLACITGVYSPETAREMLAVKAGDGENSVNGYIGKPSISRSGRHHQTIYINGRYVRNRTISEAVERAFHSMVMIGRYPVFILNIITGPEQVDVNVHPAKTEVRLAQTGRLQELVERAVAEALAGHRLIPAAPAVKVPTVKTPAETVRQEEWQVPYQEVSAAAKVCEAPVAYKDVTGICELPVPEEPAGTEGFPDLRPIGQINCTYIVAQGRDGMYLIDQHAAHERVLYEKFMDRPEQYTAGEQLLFPTTLQLTGQETQLLNDRIFDFTELGFVIEYFGGDTFLLRSVPAGISKNGGREIFLDLLDYFSRNRYRITTKDLREKLLITMACKSAIKANQKLGLPEMEALVGQLAAANQPYTCPHGRPTVIHFSGYELEKRFKRVL